MTKKKILLDYDDNIILFIMAYVVQINNNLIICGVNSKSMFCILRSNNLDVNTAFSIIFFVKITVSIFIFG